MRNGRNGNTLQEAPASERATDGLLFIGPMRPMGPIGSGGDARDAWHPWATLCLATLVAVQRVSAAVTAPS